MEHIPQSFINELMIPPMTFGDLPLKELYMEVSGRYGFTSFRLLPGGTGAQFHTEGGKQCMILQDKIVYRDERTVHTSEDFRREIAYLINQVRMKLRIPVFLTQLVVVRSVVRLDNVQSSKDFIEQNLLKFQENSYKSFGRPAVAPGVILIFPRTADINSEHRVRIEPYFQDPRMLFVENSVRFFAPIQTGEQVETNAGEACDFLRGPISEFLRSQAPTE